MLSDVLYVLSLVERFLSEPLRENGGCVFVTHGRLIVDLDALAANYGMFRDRSEAGCAAVVKANAYGLGLVPVARRLVEAGCTQFFVATEAEGAQLIKIVPETEIFVLSGVAKIPGLVPVVNRVSDIGHGPVAIHVDTGMNRLGIDPREVPDRAEIRLLITHLACSDRPEHPLNALQLERFEEVAKRFPNVPVSIANSAGVLNGVRGIGRPGIGLYGGNPYAALGNPMSCVATLEGEVLQVRTVRAGEAVGYGASYTTKRDATIAVVGIGYADGVPRALSNQGEASYGDTRLSIVGRVSMDLTHLDVTGTDIGLGDWVEFFGATIAVDEVAAWANTVSYEILTGVGDRVDRKYLP